MSSKLVEAGRRAIEAHPAYDCGSTGDEEMARAAILAFLRAALEDEGVISAIRVAISTEAVLTIDGPSGYETSEVDNWDEVALAALRALIQQVAS